LAFWKTEEYVFNSTLSQHCVEACPVDSIRIDTGIISVVDYTREEFQFDKDRLQKTTP
jgi:formate hydrogenlyase subunit 6/NADH:ubiquinone oxidoreductase subunit I